MQAHIALTLLLSLVQLQLQQKPTSKLTVASVSYLAYPVCHFTMEDSGNSPKMPTMSGVTGWSFK